MICQKKSLRDARMSDEMKQSAKSDKGQVKVDFFSFCHPVLLMS